MARKTYTYWEKFWLTNCGGNADHKGSWLAEAKCRMQSLAKELGLPKGSFDIRVNQGGPAVSGEVTLHSEELYVQASQSSGGPRMGILFRTCEGRKDYRGGHNFFAHILDLEDIHGLAGRLDVALKLRKIAA